MHPNFYYIIFTSIDSPKSINNIVLAGQVPEEIQPYFYGASLVALGKKDGGVRPIACGLTLRRIAAKCVAFKLKETCANLFEPHQMGVGPVRVVKLQPIP